MSIKTKLMLKNIRTKYLNLSQKEVGNMLGLHQASIAKMESNENNKTLVLDYFQIVGVLSQIGKNCNLDCPSILKKGGGLALLIAFLSSCDIFLGKDFTLSFSEEK